MRRQTLLGIIRDSRTKGTALVFLLLAATLLNGGCVGVAGYKGGSGNPPPVTVYNPTAANISSSGATITWTTNVPADSQVDYGTSTSYGQSAPFNPAMVTSHASTLSGLSPSTVYHYRVKSKDAAGNQATSGDLTFTTASGGNPPVISGVTATNISTTGATVSWITDKPADSQVDYGTTTSYGSSTPLDPTLVTTHSQGLSGLTPGALYHYQVKSKDGAGNQATSGDFTFTTLPDNTPPVITGVSASPMSTSALIFWTTDKPADSQVDYGTTAGYGQSSALDSTQLISHMVNLSGLTATTLYHYRVKSRGSNGLLATSGDNAFTTAQLGGIPPGLGWYQIPNTMPISVCPNPPPGGVEGCPSGVVIDSGGIADTVRNRLIFWGGGHNAYWGNEVYSLNLTANPVTLTRLNDPSPVGPNPTVTCPDVYPDNTPSSRHTWGYQTYIANIDKAYMWGGSPAPCGGNARDTWTLDVPNIRSGTNPWLHVGVNGSIWPGTPNTLPPSQGGYGFSGGAADYDPNTRLVFIHDGQSGFYSYNYQTDTYTLLRPVGGADGSALYYGYGVIDPVRKLFFAFGTESVGGPSIAFKIDISGADPTYRTQVFRPLNCGLITTETSPGLAYDSRQGKIVGWAGGDTVYVLDPATNVCTPVTYPGGPGTVYPPGNQSRLDIGGTYGRFRYFPSLNIFALINDMQQNAFTLRLTPP